MQINLTDFEKSIFEKVAKAAEILQYPTYVVGGFVRDKILGRLTKDIDIVCVGDGIILANEVTKLFHPAPQVNFFKNFGTAQIKIYTGENSENEAHEIEFVGARKESYRQESRNPVVEPGSLEDDQNRRDFTINALAISLNQDDFGELVDPFNGVGDMENKIIKTPLAPEVTFSDDPLRMMRAIRFASQLDFNIEPQTLEAISTIAKRIKIISGERIADELNKILLSPKPSQIDATSLFLAAAHT
jgi:tRNA nucleotidyltransferase/poly(A) polymerase